MADYLQFNGATDAIGYISTVARPDAGQTARVIVPNTLIASEHLGSAAKNLSDVMQATTAKLITDAKMLSDDGLRGELAKPGTIKPVGEAFRAMRDATIARRDELEARRADWATPKFPADDPGKARRVEMRDRLATMKPVQSIEAAMTNIDIATAVAEGGEAMSRIMGWTPDMWARFTEEFAAKNIASRLVAQDKSFTLRPTVDDILRSGPDHERALTEARKFIDAQTASFDEIDTVEALLGSIIDFTTVTMDNGRLASFNALMGVA